MSSLVLRKSLLTAAGLSYLLPRLLRAVLSDVSIIRRIRPALVYVNTIILPSVLLATTALGVPTVCHVHEAEWQYPRWIRRILLLPVHGADRIVAISDAVASFVLSAFPRLAPRVVVIHNGVPDAPAEPAALPAALPDPIVLTQLGRWSHRKGTDIAIDATKRLIERGWNVRLRLVGGIYPGYEAYRDLVFSMADGAEQVRLSISFVDFVNDVEEEYSRAHVALVCSRTEPLGLVAIEAQLRRRVLVTSGVDGLAEVVTDGVDAWTFPASSSEKLADVLEERFRCWPESREVAHGARQTARARFGVEVFDAELLRLLDGLLTG